MASAGGGSVPRCARSLLQRGSFWRAALVVGVVFLAQPLATRPASAAGGGGVLSWGANYRGQLGDGTTNERNVPGPVTGLDAASGVVAVAGGLNHSLAVRFDGSVLAWGDDQYGKLGIGPAGTTLPQRTPVPVAGLGAGSGVVAVAAGDNFSLALKSDGTVLQWGQKPGTGDEAHSPVPVGTLGTGSGVVAISAGTMDAMALRSDGTVLTWGWGSFGQLGDGTHAPRATPAPVPTLSGVTAISEGQLHSLALLADGSVKAWGYNANGQLGDGTNGGSPGDPNPYELTPQTVAGLGAGSGVVAVSGGNEHSTALRADGTVLAWGWNLGGQLGTGDTTDRYLPVQVTGLGAGSGVVALDAGGLFNVARRSDGSYLAWGANGSGQLGDGTTAQRNTPVAVTGLGSNVRTVVAGAQHTLAVTAPAATTAPTLTAASPPTSAVVGTAYGPYTFTATGTQPVTFTVASGTLPNGVILNPTTGVLSGTPTATGISTVTVKASNGTYPDAVSAPITITVRSVPVFTASNPESTAYTTQRYSYRFTATGSPAPTFTVASGTLPPGLVLNSFSVNGLLDGTPTTLGTYTFTIRASNGVDPDAVTGPITITVSTFVPPTFSGGTPPATATVGTAYAPYTFSFSGNPGPIGYSVGGFVPTPPPPGTPGLPPGLILNPTTGVLSGTPTQDGTFVFAITATDRFHERATTPYFTITVTGVPATFTASAPPLTATVGDPYAPYTFTAEGSGPCDARSCPRPARISLVSGSVPPGLTFVPSIYFSRGIATLSGTPTVPGTYTFVVRADDGILPNPETTVTINVYPHPFTYAPIAPTRVWDSRMGPGPTGRIEAGGTRDITIAGVNGLPTSGVTAVVLNVTAVNPSAATFVTAWPTGEARPTASNLNVPAGDTRPNLVTVKVGPGGQVSFYNDAGTTDLVVDIAGWYGSARAQDFTGVAPARVWDSRGGPGPTGRIGAAETKEITVTGVGGVPAAGVTAVVLNVTAVSPSAGTFVTAWPSGQPRPNASNLNVPAGDVRANLVIVKVGAGGKVSFYSDAGTIDLIADVAGYFGGTGSAFTSLSPIRVWDSRAGAAPGPTGRIQAAGTRDIKVAGVPGIPAGATSVVVNVTAVGPSIGTFATVWPTGLPKPIVSNLNVPAGDTRANLVTVKVGADGKISFYNDTGSTDFIADIAGYYIPHPPHSSPAT